MGADARRAPRGRPERPRDRPHGGPRVAEVMTSMLRRLLPVLATLTLLASLAPAVAAAGPTFGTPTATSKFDTGVVFNQPITVDEPIARAELLLDGRDADRPKIPQVPYPPGRGPNKATYTLDTSGEPPLAPNT